MARWNDGVDPTPDAWAAMRQSRLPGKRFLTAYYDANNELLSVCVEYIDGESLFDTLELVRAYVEELGKDSIRHFDVVIKGSPHPERGEW